MKNMKIYEKLWSYMKIYIIKMWCCIKCKRPIEEWCGQPGSQNIHNNEIHHNTPEYDKTLIRNLNDQFKFLYNRKVFVAYCRKCEYHLQFYQSRI